jgi:hypothetical protein
MPQGTGASLTMRPSTSEGNIQDRRTVANDKVDHSNAKLSIGPFQQLQPERARGVMRLRLGRANDDPSYAVRRMTAINTRHDRHVG